MDGSGYPGGALGDSIHPYARIIAVADLYDAVTSERPYNGKQSPFLAARIIAEEMFGKLDTFVATTFLEHMRDHLVGAHVNLSDGRKAEVILFGGDFTFQPVIRTQNGDFVDVGSNPSVQIKEMVVV
jgi:HD-GYP domain-containing protein (c-di-GMP phosphodiesterase class II)